MTNLVDRVARINSSKQMAIQNTWVLDVIHSLANKGERGRIR